MPKAEVTDELRHSYKQFVESLAGKHFIAYLLSKEVEAQAEGRRGTSLEVKGLAMVKLNTAYDVRSFLDGMSAPAQSPKSRSTKGSE